MVKSKYGSSPKLYDGTWRENEGEKSGKSLHLQSRTIWLKCYTICWVRPTLQFETDQYKENVMSFKRDASDSYDVEGQQESLLRCGTVSIMHGKLSSLRCWPWESLCHCAIAGNCLCTELGENLANGTKVCLHFSLLRLCEWINMNTIPNVTGSDLDQEDDLPEKMVQENLGSCKAIELRWY